MEVTGYNPVLGGKSEHPPFFESPDGAHVGSPSCRANLEYMPKIYLLWHDRAVLISQKPSGKLPTARIRQTASGKSPAAITQEPSAKLSLRTTTHKTLPVCG
jgi:hypothetical protein